MEQSGDSRRQLRNCVCAVYVIGLPYFWGDCARIDESLSFNLSALKHKL